MKTYCPECGTKIEYTAKKPNFCINCGYAFAGTKPPEPSYKDHLETIEEEPSQVPQLDGLDVELEVLLPAFFFGCILYFNEHKPHSKTDQLIDNSIKFTFLFLSESAHA